MIFWLCWVFVAAQAFLWFQRVGATLHHCAVLIVGALFLQGTGSS